MAIKQLKSGKWQIDYSVTVHDDSGENKRIKRVRESYSTFESAKIRQMEISRKRKDGERLISKNCPLKGVVFRYREWLGEQGKSINYLKRVDSSIKELFPIFDVNIKSLSYSLIDDYFSYQRSTGKAGQTILNEYSVIRAASKWGRRRGFEIPYIDYELPKITHKVPEIPTPTQIQEIFNFLYGHSDKDTIDTKKAFYFYLATGCRFSEGAAVQVSDISNDMIKFHRETKRGYTRYCPLPDFPFELPKKGLILTRLGQPWLENCLRKRIQRACKESGCHKITIHTLRHAHATYSLALGDNIYDVMSRCGWKSFQIVQNYVTAAKHYKIKSYLPKWK